MKKIININLSGRVIPIEDSAYEQLQSYIESLRKYFAHEDGRDEIINDIESRIAEIMDEKIRKGASCITEDDVEGIVKTMGRPEDFDEEPAEATYSHKQTSSSNQSEYTSYSEPKKKNRLYRDSSDKIVGGVCSGLANYLNVDPAIIRLLFAIITFGGFGSGILIYALFWIILPQRDLEKHGGKRLYRNPEERVLGGVASGIAAYFDKEPYLVRLVFAAPLLLNVLLSILSWPFFHAGAIFPNLVFGSLTGTFILAYIILWIVLPEAKSQYQKMEMRGEKVDVNTIRMNVKDKAKEFGEDVKESAQKLGAKAKEFATSGRGAAWGKEVGEAGVRVGVGVGHVIGVLFKAFFLFVAGTIAFGLFVALMALLFGGIGIWPLKNYILNGFWQNIFAWGTLIFFLCVPVIAFITWLVRRMMRVRSQKSYLGWMFGGLWTLGWVSASLLAASLVNDFRRNQKVDIPVTVSQPLKGKMLVKVNEPEVRFNGNFWWLDVDNEGWDINEDTLRMANIKVRIEKSEDTNYHVSISKYSAGRDGNDARGRANNILYAASYTDSVLNLGSGLSVSKDDKFRFQRIIVNIKVPVGKKIRFDESVDVLHPYNIRMYEKRRWQRNDWDVDWDWDNYFDYETNVDYTMKADGELNNPNKPVEKKEDEQKDGYRYQDKDQQKQDIKQREEELERNRKQLEEDKKQLNDTITPKSTTLETMDDINDETGKKEETGLNIASPVFTLATMFN